MLETSIRLLRLLELLQSRPYWSGRELAERLEVETRTIRRDIERLRRLGYPVDARPGVAGGYRLRAGASLPPLLLDDEEAVAIAVGLRTAVSGGVAGIGETSVRALSKLEGLLPARVRRRVQAVSTATVPYPASGPVVDPEVLLALATRAATTSVCGSATAATTASEAGGSSSRTGWFTPAAIGTWSPGTPGAWTGARSGSTGSTPRRGCSGGSSHAVRRPPTSPRGWHGACRAPATATRLA